MNSQKRILHIFLQLLSGKKLIKKDLMEKYGKQSSTIQRDMSAIQETINLTLEDFFEQGAANTDDFEEYIEQYSLNREEKGAYQLNDFRILQSFSDVEILTIIDILLASRSLSNEEMQPILEKLISFSQNRESLKKMIRNEMTFYHGVPDEPIMKKIETIYQAINEHLSIEFQYSRYDQKVTLSRDPQAIYFSDLYFYVITSSHSGEDGVNIETTNKFRINKIENLKLIPREKSQPYRERFEASTLRKQTYFPFLGNPITMIIDFSYEPTYVLDRFPDSKILYEKDGVYRMELKVNDGYGVKMWLLSQATMVKIISPKYMRDYVNQAMIDDLAQYGYRVIPPEDK